MAINVFIKRQFRKIHRSIAFIPTLVVVLFILLSILMIYLDYSEWGKNIKTIVTWIRLKDPSTARTVISVIAAGLISITVFSFSMVMVVLNQAASQLSNRVLDKLVGNRLHQFIIGYYIGNIIFALLLLTSIRDVDSGVYVPALSTYLLILLSMVALLLFVLFIHFITHRIKYATIIRGISRQTQKLMEEACYLSYKPADDHLSQGQPLLSNKSGVFEAFEIEKLVKMAQENDCVISFRYPPGDYVLKDAPIGDVYCNRQLIPKELMDEIVNLIFIVDEPTEDIYYYSGLKQLSEIAIRALSPGINDPGTAAVSLQELFSLLNFRRLHFPEINIRDAGGTIRVTTRELSFDELIERYLMPIWDYGKDDRTIRRQMHDLIRQLGYDINLDG